MSLIEQLKTDVEQHGEVHAVVEEHDAEVEIRQGTAEFDADAGLITLDNGQTTMRFGIDRVVSWYKPMGFYHE